jgi:hypothetical protein
MPDQFEVFRFESQEVSLILDDIVYNKENDLEKLKSSAQKANIETDKAEWMSLIKKTSQCQRFDKFLRATLR